MSSATVKIIRASSRPDSGGRSPRARDPRLGIGDLIGRDEPGSDGSERIAALSLVPGAAPIVLIFTFGEIVDQYVARHILQRALPSRRIAQSIR